VEWSCGRKKKRKLDEDEWREEKDFIENSDSKLHFV
jgi:hypothetical protein